MKPQPGQRWTKDGVTRTYLGRMPHMVPSSIVYLNGYGTWIVTTGEEWFLWAATAKLESK